MGPAMSDEADEGKSAEEQGEEGAEGEEEQDPSFPARLNIVVEKANKGALAVEAVIQDGMVVIDNVYYYTDAAHAHAKSADKVHERQDLYVGPPFGNLDEDLQVLLERYLYVRGREDLIFDLLSEHTPHFHSDCQLNAGWFFCILCMGLRRCYTTAFDATYFVMTKDTCTA